MQRVRERIAGARKTLAACGRFLSEHPWFASFLVFSSAFLAFFLLYFSVSTVSSADDQLFHFPFALQMRLHGFFQSFWDFKAIYFSRFAQSHAYFMYYNFLFYLVIIPFTFIQPLFLASKLFAVIVAALVVASFYWVLKRLSVRNPFFWTVAVLAVVGTVSLYRFFAARPFSLAPSLLLLLLYFLYRRNKIGVFVLSFLYLFWHSSTFFFPLVIAATYYFVEFLYRPRGDWRNLAASAGGTAAAVGAAYLVSPGFLLFINDTVVGIFWQTILGKYVPIQEGGELYPLGFFTFIQRNLLMFAALIISATASVGTLFSRARTKVAWSPSEDLLVRRRSLETCLFVLSIAFFLGTIVISSRFNDFLTLFAPLFVILFVDRLRRSISFSMSGRIRRGLLAGLMIAVAYLLCGNLLALQQMLSTGGTVNTFYQIGGWLKENSKPGDIVFLSNWSWFPQLYYYSPDDNYVAGLEPRFLYDYRPSLYWEYAHLSSGYVCGKADCPQASSQADALLAHPQTALTYAQTEGDKMYAVLRDDFHASYVVTNSDYLSFVYILSHNSHFRQVVYDGGFKIWLFALQ